MLFYRARVEGPVAAVLSLSAGPVRPATGPGGGGGQARVTLRYALAPGGQVRTHRGWLHVDLPAGTRLALAGYQADGDALLLSLRPVRQSHRGPQQLLDRFRLPFRLGGGGVDVALQAISVRLRASCRCLPGALLVRGRLVLEAVGQAGRHRVVVPFCRLLPAPVDPLLRWRACGGVSELFCRAAGGELAGEAVLDLACLGIPLAGPPAEEAPAVAAVRELTARVARVEAGVAGQGRAVVRGALEVEVAWADQAGFSRWTSREVSFAAPVEVPGSQEGDRLEAVAAVDRLTRLNGRLCALVAVGVTALRPVHLCLEGQYYRVEQVMGQAITTLEVAEPLFRQPALPPAPVCHSLAEAVLPEGVGPWPTLWIRLRDPATTGRGWRCLADLKKGATRRVTVPLSGPLPGGAQPLLAGLEAVGSDAIRVRAHALAPLPGALSVKPATYGADGATSTHVDLPGALRALSDLILIRGRPWEVRLLVHLDRELLLVAADLEIPRSGPCETWQPLDAVAVAVSPQRVRVDVQWKRITA